MINIDKFNRPIFPKIYQILCNQGNNLLNLGYRESYNKPNLFLKTGEYGTIFADMRGTNIIPVWENTDVLLYLKPNKKAENWQFTRWLEQELKSLNEHKIPNRFSFYGNYPHFDNTNSQEDTEPTGNGYCVICGYDMQKNGFTCSKNCELLEKRLHEYHSNCKICDSELLNHGSGIEHHTDYEHNITILVCPQCHARIHSKNNYLYAIYKPVDKRPKKNINEDQKKNTFKRPLRNLIM
jgi:hypothetical protein